MDMLRNLKLQVGATSKLPLFGCADDVVCQTHSPNDRVHRANKQWDHSRTMRRVCRVPEDCPQEVAALVARCMAQEPKNRPTAHEIITALRESMGLLPDTISGDLDGSILSAPRSRVNKGRRFIPGLQMSDGTEDGIPEEGPGDDSDEGEKVPQTLDRASMNAYLAPYMDDEAEPEAAEDELQGLSSVTSYGAAHGRVVEDDLLHMREQEIPRRIFRKWKSSGENR